MPRVSSANVWPQCSHDSSQLPLSKTTNTSPSSNSLTLETQSTQMGGRKVPKNFDTKTFWSTSKTTLTDLSYKRKEKKNHRVVEAYKRAWRIDNTWAAPVLRLQSERKAREMRQVRTSLPKPSAFHRNALRRNQKRSRFIPEACKILHNNEPHSPPAWKWHLRKYWQSLPTSRHS